MHALSTTCPISKITRSAISRKLIDQNKKKNYCSGEYIFTPLYLFWTQKSKYKWPIYKARHAHKRLYTVLPKYSKIQVLPGITSCRLVKDNKQAIELNSLLLNNMPKDG